MSAHIKDILYSRLIRSICKFPGFVKFFYGFYQFTVIHAPFLRTSFKWRLIKTTMLHFELNRALYLRGKKHESNNLYLLKYSENTLPQASNRGTKSFGSFSLDIDVSGLAILGKLKKPVTGTILVRINDIILRKTSLRNEKYFKVRVRPSILSNFPVQSQLTAELESGEKLFYGKSTIADLNVPYGNGILETVLENGFQLSKKGNMGLSAEMIHDRQNKYLELYALVKKVFDAEFSIPLFLTYGTLLGFTRGKDFIPNDDDFDAGYISEKKTPKEVKSETLQIIHALLLSGFNISINPSGRLFKISKNTGVHLDLMPVWFEGEWNIAFRGIGVKASISDFLPAKTGQLRNVDVYTPNNPEKFLSGYYGAKWMIPDPGYVSDFRQTGTNFIKNYDAYLLSPKEYFTFLKILEREKKEGIVMGNFTSSSLSAEF